MKHSFYLAAAILLLASCNKPFKKLEGGLQYKIVSDGKGKQVKPGSFFELRIDQEYKGSNKDTVLVSSKDFPGQIIPMDSNAIPQVYYKIFLQARAGDSIVVKQLTDSLMKGGGQVPPFMKKGAYIIAKYKVVTVYDTKVSADSAMQAIMIQARSKDSLKAQEQLKIDDKEIKDYLAKKNITATKAPKGTYVQILTPGEGDAIDTSKVAKIMYSCKDMNGKVYDSNTDPKFGHSDPIQVHMDDPGGLIAGWYDGLSLMKKGSKAVFFIPSSLAYGARGKGDIKPNSNLMFDMEVVDVISNAQAMTEEMEERKKMQAEQQRMMDSARNAQKGAVKK